MYASKLSADDRIINARQRNRALKKSAAVDDDPTGSDIRRAASFDTSQMAAQQAAMKPVTSATGSFDVASSRMSAFSPVDVPRLLIHTPNSPLYIERQQTPDNRLLTVPSPDYPRKSPNSLDPRHFRSESPKLAPGTEYMSMAGIPPTLLGQLAMASMNLTQVRDAGDPPKSSIIQMEHFRHNVDCSGSLETLASASASSLDLALAGPSGLNHDHAQHPSASAELLAQMPAKSVIQDDIRSSQGRFMLVRKRGRSEVWNLFGQVLDTLTNTRLPYVACYACKVLYTDTGGGTGNMTRHRCPIGMSYRSSAHGSSTETVEAGQMTSSFESSVSVMNRTNEQKPPLSLTINQDNSPAQLLSQNSGEVSIGDVDREILTDAIVRCCAQDMLDPALFNCRGFRTLFDRIWQLSKRAIVSPAEIYPDNQAISSHLQTNLRFCADDLKNELSRTSQGVCLTLESLSYNGRDFKVVHCSRISHDWKWRSNVLGVFKARENQSLIEIVNLVIHNYELDKNLLRITCSRNREEFLPTKTFIDVKEKLREVLYAVFNTTPIGVLPMLTTVNDILKRLVEAEIRLPFDYLPCVDDLFAFHDILHEWNEHLSSIDAIIKSKCPGLVNQFNSLNAANLKDIEHFLHPFTETIDSLLEEKPNFHKVLPEWLALMHECQPSEEDTSTLLRDLKQKATEMLERERPNVISVEHRIAAILNPRINKKLSTICTEQEKQGTCDKIRHLCGIRNQREPLSRGSSSDGEPHRKRRMFLSALEEDPVSDDELECYLRSQFPSIQTKDMISFWSSVGSQQFPALSSLARRILSVPATAPKTEFDIRVANVASDQLHTFLMLRSMFDTERD